MMEHETNGSSSPNKENPRNASGKFSRALNFYEKHFRFGRFLQAFYLLLIIGGFQMFLIFGLPYLPNPRLSRIHIVLPFLVVFFTVFTFSLASASSPGYVTSVNFSRLEKIYPYDNFLFIQGRVCPTCGTPKVARSKHCSFKGRCVERYDHYCPWIDNTIGCLNQRFFLLFVVSTEILLIYAVFILWNILYFIVETNTLFDLQYFIPTTNQLVSADLFIVAKFMFYHYPTLTFLFSICTIMGMFLFCFILYQVYLIYNGFTTNEFYKWRYIYRLYKSKKWSDELKVREQNSQNFRKISDNLSLEERPLWAFPINLPKNKYDRESFMENFIEIILPLKYRILKESDHKKGNQEKID